MLSPGMQITREYTIKRATVCREDASGEVSTKMNRVKLLSAVHSIFLIAYKYSKATILSPIVFALELRFSALLYNF